MEEQKEAQSQSPMAKNNVLENGTYSIYGPENGEIMIDTIELHAGSGAQRIWKVKRISKKEITLEIVKFA